MNEPQRLWWRQAASDFEIYALLAHAGAPQCHQLHYLQMATEKLAKAYLWQSSSPPPKSHTGFVQFLRLLGASQSANRDKLSSAIGYHKYADLANWVKRSLSIAHELERLAPTLAGTGENPEYPWPHSLPAKTPIEHEFTVWKSIMNTSGRTFLKQLKYMILNFEGFAHL